MKPELTRAELKTALDRYEDFMQLPGGSATLAHVAHFLLMSRSRQPESEGVWSLIQISSSRLAAMSTRWCSAGFGSDGQSQQIAECERALLTVDSGESDTVVPPNTARNLLLLHSFRVGGRSMRWPMGVWL